MSKLNELNEILYRIHDELDIMRITLIAITAGQGLRFNRAFILLADQENKVLKGISPLVPSDEDEANRIWTELNHEHLIICAILSRFTKLTSTALIKNERNCRANFCADG
ncbi:MAG: hypothetical protein R3C26_07230 [Calditrichia bacterium]